MQHTFHPAWWSRIVLSLFLASFVLAGCGSASSVASSSLGMYHQLTPMKLALDWVPNSSHAGIYVALAKGWYRAAGIDLQIVPFGKTFPDILVAANQAEVGISTTDNVVQDAAKGFPVISIGAIYQHNQSVLVTRGDDSGLTRPRDLDGKIYGGYGAPYDVPMVSQIIKSDGGVGKFRYINLGTGSLQALESHQIDFAWVFHIDILELQAQQPSLKFHEFKITDYGVPDYYSPVFISSQHQIQSNPALLRTFMAVTSRGYRYSASHEKEAETSLLGSTSSISLNPQAVAASQRYSSPLYMSPRKAWGWQNPGYWESYVKFMLGTNTLTDSSRNPVRRINSTSLYTNTFLPH